MLMLIGRVALTPVALRSATVSSSITLLSPGLPSYNRFYLGPVQRPNTEVWRMLFRNVPSFGIYFLSFTFRFLVHLLSTLITNPPYVSLAILFNTNARSILKLTFILFVRRSLLNWFGFCTSHLRISIRTSSPNAYHENCFLILYSVSLFAL